MIVWLASYPRSGNTFFRVVLNRAFGLKTYSIYNDESDIAANARTAEVVGHERLPEHFDFKKARAEDKVYVIKTHGPPPSSKDKVVYLVRDGREVLVSYARYLNSYKQSEFSVLDVIVGNVPFGTWGAHLNAWTGSGHRDRLLITFEQLTGATQELLPRISEFLGIPVVSEELPGFSDLNAINPTFFRSGKVDGWRRELAEEDLLAFWLLNRQQMNAYYPDAVPPDRFGTAADFGLAEAVCQRLTGRLQELNENLQAEIRQNRSGSDRHGSRNPDSFRQAAAEFVRLSGSAHPLRKLRAYGKLKKALLSG